MKRKMVMRLALVSTFVVLATLHHQYQPMIRPPDESTRLDKEKSLTCPCGGCAS